MQLSSIQWNIVGPPTAYALKKCRNNVGETLSEALFYEKTDDERRLPAQLSSPWTTLFVPRTVEALTELGVSNCALN
jgi:hypothetical protein